MWALPCRHNTVMSHHITLFVFGVFPFLFYDFILNVYLAVFFLCPAALLFTAKYFLKYVYKMQVIKWKTLSTFHLCAQIFNYQFVGRNSFRQSWKEKNTRAEVKIILKQFISIITMKCKFLTLSLTLARRSSSIWNKDAFTARCLSKIRLSLAAFIFLGIISLLSTSTVLNHLQSEHK